MLHARQGLTAVFDHVLHSDISGISKIGIISIEQMMEAQGREMTCTRQVTQLEAFPGNQVSLLPGSSSLGGVRFQKYFFNLSSLYSCGFL